MSHAPSLAEHLRAAASPEPDGLAAVVEALAGAGVRIARELARAALVGRLGSTGEINVQGEIVKKLDAWGNDVVVDALAATGLVCTLVSEEMEEPLHVEASCARARYVVCFDPVDGSSNLDVNGVVGTIFSIRPRSAAADHPGADVLAPGLSQVAAGYVMYGPATQLVCATGHGVDGFTLDPDAGTFVRTHAGIRIPARGRTYSVNEGNARRWLPDLRRFVEYLKREDAATGRPYSARYAGSFVADFHRTLLEGGVFLYPAAVSRSGKASGKLRLLYEAAPMALVCEQAGGRASTGNGRILEVSPTSPHERVPLIIGSPEDVELAEAFFQQQR